MQGLGRKAEMNGTRISVGVMAGVCLSLFFTITQAQESRLATQSVRCAAIFSVLGETAASEPKYQARFKSAETIFSELFVKESSDKKDTVTLDEAHRRRDLVLKELRDTYANRRAYIIEETVVCGAWGEGFLVQGETYGYVPVIPKVIPQNIRADYEAKGSAAFAAWILK
jgi:type III secretory pathway component EscS